MKTEDEKTQQGDDATLSASNAEDQDHMGLETDLIIQDEVGESNANENEQDEEGNDDNEQEQSEEADKQGDNGTEQAPSENPSDKNGKGNNELDDDRKQRLSGAARKRMRYLISQGYSKEEAREKSLRPVSNKRDGSPDSRSSKKIKGIKICIVLDKYPEELLNTEQLKFIQESITDKILEMGPDATVKPKFFSSTHQQGWLAIICADKPTMEWLKEIVPTIEPVEESSLKALEDEEMPHLETYVTFLPDSKDYSDEKIIKLLEHQNDSFTVSNWKIIKKETVEDEVEVTFSIDRKHSVELKKAGYKACYKFGHVQLYPKEKEKKRSDSTEKKDSSSKSESGDSKRAKLSPRHRRSPERSQWKGEGRNYNRKPKRGGSGGRGFRGSRSNEFRAGGSSWSNNSGSRNNQSWFADPWNKPWKNS